MLSVIEAQNKILSQFFPLGTELVQLDFVSGRILSQSIHASFDLPSFDNSTVDGFALRTEDISSANTETPVIVQVIADIPAGIKTNTRLNKGQAARIMTGAPVPGGADAVIMVEDTDSDRYPKSKAIQPQIKIFKALKIGENIRRRGTDIISGQEILVEGKLLRPQDIGILAMLGISSVPVRKKPRVAIISSGDELLPVDAPLEPGKIHDSNTYMLSALAQKAGCEVIRLGVASDHYDALETLFLQAAASKPDLIISSAGVSVGTFDYVKEVVESSGNIEFWKVNMRPGKPFAFGTYQSIPFFGLPGNPVSAFVSFLLFVQPVLELLTGVETNYKNRVRVVLEDGIESDGRESYLRAIIRKNKGVLLGSLTGRQSSGDLFSLVQANALLIIPSGVKSCPPGSEVDAWILE